MIQKHIFQLNMELLQPLQWRCVKCVIHHERDVHEEKHHIYVGQTSNNRVISIVACCHSAKLCAHAAQDFWLQQNQVSKIFLKPHFATYKFSNIKWENFLPISKDNRPKQSTWLIKYLTVQEQFYPPYPLTILSLCGLSCKYPSSIALLVIFFIWPFY